MHAPHPPERYLELLQQALIRGRPIRMGEVHWLMLGSVHPNETGATGTIYRFVRLDPTEPWLNARTGEAATGDDLREIRLPEHLLPHLKEFPFEFRTDTHRLYYVSHDRKNRLGPAAVKPFLEALFKPFIDSGEFPEVNVTVVPDQETLARIFAMHRLETLTIELTRPNADDGADQEARWMDRLERQHSKKLKLELTAEREESLSPDTETRALAAVAADNGRVTAVGRDAAGIKQYESTEQKPLVQAAEINPELQTVFNVLSTTADMLNAR